MEGNRFDDIARVAHQALSRRVMLRTIASGGLALTGERVAGAARRRRKGTSKLPRPNAFGCLDVGAPCTKARQCCSSLCTRRNGGRKRCRSHDEGGCPAGYTPNNCADGPGQNVPCTTSAGNPGKCYTTTGNAGYCGTDASIVCHDCTRDAECQSLLGPGAACVDCIDDCGTPACVGPAIP